MRSFLILVPAFLASCQPPSTAEKASSSENHELCATISDFETASFAPKQKFRYVEVSSSGSWLVDHKLSCAAGTNIDGDSAARSLCNYLARNSSMEFFRLNPMGVMECYGIEFPSPKPVWNNWRTVMELKSTDDYQVWLEIDYAFAGSTDHAYRLGVYPWSDNLVTPDDSPFWEESESEWIEVEDE